MKEFAKRKRVVAEVHVAPQAAADLRAIFDYLLEAGGFETAERLLNELDTLIRSLTSFPERGKYPPELLSKGITLFREVQCYPWRIFYHIVESDVWVVAVLDARRNIARLLPARLAQ